jgi:hypothetical protein
MQTIKYIFGIVQKQSDSLDSFVLIDTNTLTCANEVIISNEPIDSFEIIDSSELGNLDEAFDSYELINSSKLFDSCSTNSLPKKQVSFQDRPEVTSFVRTNKEVQLMFRKEMYEVKFKQIQKKAINLMDLSDLDSDLSEFN